MSYFIRFANPNTLFLFLPFLLFVILYRLKYCKSNKYLYPLGCILKKEGLGSSCFFKKILFLLRFLVLFILVLLIAKPQLIDYKSKIKVEGRDIVLALDVSGSMRSADFSGNKKTRLDVAKEEAIKFINKRGDDQIGLVLFGRAAISRCPLTLDKNILREIIKGLHVGVIDYTGTVLAVALMNAINRLKVSKAKSKVIILLTDGQPTQEDIPANIPIGIAKRLNIKIYTIGIGSEGDQVFNIPGWGQFPVMGAGLNKKLLIDIAQETGGQFFWAENSKDIGKIYDRINRLEATKYDTNIFYKYYDFFIPLIWFVILLILLELFLSTFIWFVL